MANAMDLVVLAIFLLGVITYAAAVDVQLLAIANAICVVSSPLLAYTVPIAFGHVCDVGGVFFAVSMYGLALKCLLYSTNQIYRAARHILFALAVSLGSLMILQAGNLLTPDIADRLQAECTRFFLFWVMQAFFVRMHVADIGLPRLVHITAVNIILLTLDGVLFFPCAYFGVFPMAMIVPMMVAGTVLRTIVTTLSVPFLALLIRLKHKGLVPRPGQVIILDSER